MLHPKPELYQKPSQNQIRTVDDIEEKFTKNPRHLAPESSSFKYSESDHVLPKSEVINALLRKE